MKKELADRLLNEVRDFYDAAAVSFSETRREPWKVLERAREFAHNGDAVLDVGCGNGRAYQLFSGLAIAYEGLDVSEGLLAEARKNVQDQLAHFRAGSVMSLPYADASFEEVLAVGMMHHIPSAEYRRRALGEMSRVLKPGGTLFMTNWWLCRRDRRTKWLLLAWWNKLLGRSGLDWNDTMIPWKRGDVKSMRYVHCFTGREAARLCRGAGLEVVDQYYAAAGERVPFWKGENLVTICRKPVLRS